MNSFLANWIDYVMVYHMPDNTYCRIEDSFTVRHLHDWYSRQFPIDHCEAAQAALDYLASLEDHEQANAIDSGWLKLAESLNHYQLYR